MRRDAVLRHNVEEACATSNGQTLRDVYRDALGLLPKTVPDLSRCESIYGRAFLNPNPLLRARGNNWIDCEGRAAGGKLVVVAQPSAVQATGTVTGIDGVKHTVTFNRDGADGGWTMSELCQTSPPT